ERPSATRHDGHALVEVEELVVAGGHPITPASRSRRYPRARGSTRTDDAETARPATMIGLVIRSDPGRPVKVARRRHPNIRRSTPVRRTPRPHDQEVPR